MHESVFIGFLYGQPIAISLSTDLPPELHTRFTDNFASEVLPELDRIYSESTNGVIKQ